MAVMPALPAASSLPADLVSDIERAGYYPTLVADVVAHALAGEAPRAYLVHQETTFDEDTVRRHITVLAVTSSRLVIAHADDHTDPAETRPVATANCETVPLSAVRGVMTTHVVPDPVSYVPGSLGREITVTLGWGAVSRVDLLPAVCADPGCDGDHGYDGTVTADDISLRISADADGDAALARAIDFAAALSSAIGRSHLA